MPGLRKAQLLKPAWRVHANPMALPRPPKKDETPLNRFDDPQREYLVRYWATNKRGAFLEVLARFRTHDETQARLRSIKSVNEKAEPALTPGEVPRKFLRELKEVSGRIKDPKHEFIDVAAAETLAALGKNADIRAALKRSGLGGLGQIPDLDEGTIRLAGPRGRLITQAVSRVIFDETTASGIRYTSRLDAAEPCWAIFDWVEVKFSNPALINPHDAELRSATAFLGLRLPAGYSRN